MLMHMSGTMVVDSATQSMPLDCLALVANKGYVCRSHRSVTNKREIVLKGTAQRQQTEIPILSVKEVISSPPQLQPKGQASNLTHT